MEAGLDRSNGPSGSTSGKMPKWGENSFYYDPKELGA